ncbi:MAG: tandem-95 repeat protein [Aphanizomenon flos-aquae DEX188]|nr:MAG: tandem-95 repeat protein [Aphanizomenon flos-aquae DEX188]
MISNCCKLNVNEAPVITSPATATFAENGTGTVYTVTATDVDTGTTLTYSLSGTDASFFNINNGAVTFKTAPNFEVPTDNGANNVYDINVIASDGASNTTKAVAITVTNVNEAPVITSAATATFAENGTGTVYTVTATDVDAATTLTYSLSGTDASFFNINNGAVTFKTAPNFEVPTDNGANNVYDINVIASDGASNTTKAVAITVTNVNEAPVITSATTATFAENGTGTVYTVTATDEEGTTLTYSLSGTDASFFNINNGAVTFKTAPNFEVPTDNGANNVYDINVIASDGASNTTKAVAITVTNVNEAPVITSAATATFAENSTETVYTVTATDVDAATTLTYSLSGTDASFFNINNGAVTFKTAPNFEVPTDNGADNVYDINVIASDGTLTDTEAVAITVTNVNEAPVITSAATATFAENSTETVYTVTATDVDAATTLTYSLSGTDANLFNINNGVVTFKTAPNFEVPTDNGADNVYDINVIASDGTLTDTEAVAITVTNVNEAPVITSAATATFAENSTETVYTVTATDVDAATTLTYSLSGTDANLFNINNGAVTFKTAPNFEVPTDNGADNVYDINVIASDGTLTDTEAVAITVTNVNEVPVITSAATANFAENATGTVYTVTATDVDASTIFTYSLSGTDANLFNINNGVVTFKTAPNFEVPTDNGADNVYDINVIASDGTLTDTEAVAITVTNVNEAPVITSAATATFAENSTGTVYTVTATDVDASTIFTYSLSGTDANLFNINNGVVTFKTAPNFELPSDSGADNVYDINVIASDGTSTATEAVAITVTNVNEVPVITSATTATFAENSTGTVYTVTATDVDASTIFTYSLSGTDANLFNINNGVVTFKTAPNFELPSDSGADNVYDINVIASDGTLTDTEAVAITVTNVNEVPVITSATTATFAENSTGTVYTVTATDVDASTIFTYSLSGTDANLFNINNGVVTFKTAPNFELPSDSGADNVYDINVIASDGTLTDTEAVAITVTNVNEVPVITSAATANFAENATGTVYTVTATDVDASTIFTYSLSGTDANLFNINNGAVTFKTAPNFELPSDSGANNVYDINVIASDGALTATKAVAITVTNVNEVPVITSAATANFAENATGTVYTVTATDVDASTIFTYSLSGTDANLFNINNGAVTFKTAPNFELPSDSGADNVYDINVIASDGTLTDTEAVAITVTNVNEVPVITSAATANFAENATGTVYTVTATDVDASTIFTYSLSGTDANLFNINNGAVTFKTAPNFELPSDSGANNVYDINVIASDGALTATKAVAITVTNVNEVPVITSAATANFAENATGTVYTVTATDVDASTIFTYSLSGTDANLFNINNGAVTFKTAPNFELPSDSGANNIYDINVIASDGALNTTKAVAITVTNVNEIPIDLALSNSTIAENQAINTVVGSFTTTDPDTGNTFTYTLVSGTGDTDNNVFTITNNELKTKAVFDYETKNSYSIRVKTTDQGGLSFEKQLTIGVSNVNEPPVITTPITFSIPENAKSVGKINAEDPEKDAITFALAGINASLLAINPTTGELSFKTAPDFEKPLDNEKKNLYKTQVEVKDANNNQAIQDIIITVTNVNETPIAIDDQLSIIQGSFGTINPLINDSDPDGDTLEITSKTDGKYGKVDINGNNLTYTLLDAKYTGKDVFNYTTSDKNGLESTARVNVTIADKNITKETSQVTSVNPDNSLFPKEAGTQTGIVDKVSYSFSTNYNQSTGKQTLENTLKQTSAAFTNLFGLYEIDDATGAVNGILPGQSGYAKAALSKVVSNFVVRAGGSGNGVTGDVIVSGDKTYAPFVIANGGKSSGNIQEAINAFFGANPNNSAATAQDYTSLPVAYFSFGAANPDGAAHIKSLGNNIFGFEDLPAGVGVSDYDFNDIVFSFGF